MTRTRALVVYGAGGHATSVADTAMSTGRVVFAFVDPLKAGSLLLGKPIVSDVSHLESLTSYEFAIAIGDNAVRQDAFERISACTPDACFPALVHKAACVSPSAVIDQGTIVGAHATVGPRTKIGKFCILNTQASLDHDCVLCDFASLAPSACTGGAVTIGKRSAISLSAAVKHGVNVGSDCVLGAKSYLHNNLLSNTLAFGVPARVIRQRSRGESYLH